MNSKNKKKNSRSSKKIATKNRNIFLLILFLVFAFVLVYILSPDVRFFIDEKIIGKYVNEENATEIYLNAQNNPQIIVYDNNIGVLEKGELAIYNKSGQLVNMNEKLYIPMATPIIKTNDKHLVLVEKKGKKVFLINDDKIIWNRELDFNINNVNVNTNGYVVVTGSNSIYKSIVAVINNEGEELFNIYISSNIVVDAEISNDNKILAIAEVNYSKPVVESIIKYISVDKAMNDPTNSEIKTYKQNKLIVDITFKSKDLLLAHYSKEVFRYTKSEEEKIYDISENTQFIDLKSGKNIIVLEQVKEGVFSEEYQLTILNDRGKTKGIYKIGKFVPKELKISRNYIAVNLGQEALFLTIDGWEKKKYEPNKEIREVLISEKLGTVLYKNSFNIVDF